VTLGRNQHNAIKDGVVALHLRFQPMQRVDVALDLEPNQMPVDNCDVSAAPAVLEAKFVEDEGLRIAMVPREALAMIGCPNLRVVHGRASSGVHKSH
jgi:hypothetical protein